MSILPGLPRASHPDAQIRRFLGWSVIVWACISAALAMFGDVPRPVPGWALSDRVVFRALITLALFLIGALVINVVALVFHGWLFTGFSAGPAEAAAEQVAGAQEADALQDAVTAMTKIATGVDEIVSGIDDRLKAVEGSCGVATPEDSPPKIMSLLEGPDAQA